MRIYLLVIGCVFAAQMAMAQTEGGQEAYDTFWAKTDSEYKDPKESPLSDEDRLAFDSIARFSFDENYRVEAKWIPQKRQKPVKFQTSSDVVKTYQKVAIIEFVLDGDTLNLSAYQSLDLMRNPAYKDYIFVPFTDESSGLETYGGGRYLDFSRPDEEIIILDFNQAYNPYCAYSDGYSCPIPPRENHLKVKILAGAKPGK
jgi:uncharacterized protein (DUF1684 family)